MGALMENKIKGSYVEKPVCEMLANGLRNAEIVRRLKDEYQFDVSWHTLQGYVETYFSKMEAKAIENLRAAGQFHKEASDLVEVKLTNDYTKFINSLYRGIEWHEGRIEAIESVMENLGKDKDGKPIAIDSSLENALIKHNDKINELREKIHEIVDGPNGMANFMTDVVGKAAEQIFNEFKVDYPGPRRKELATRIQKAMKRVQV